MPKLNTFGLTIIAAIMAIVALTSAPAQTQVAEPEYRYPHLSAPRWQYYQQHPEEFQQLLKSMPPVSHELVQGTTLTPGQAPTSGSWTSLNNPAGVNLMNPILLTDGTVIAHVSCTPDWYKLTPDNTGSYANGTWAQVASTSNNYGPRFFGSGVLPDGRVIMEGGEYNTGCRANSRTTLGAIYDPLTDAWTPVAPPPGWSTISDAGGIVLPNGTYMQTSCCDLPTPHAALLDPSTLTWTNTGTGKFDVYDEEAMALLHDGTVLTVDGYVFTGTCGQGSERYDPGTGLWTSAGTVGNQQSDCNSPAASFEVGPVVMRPDGTAVSFSGLTSGTASTAIYNVAGHSWTVGPDILSVGGVPYTLADAPAAVLPNGNILFAASPGNWTSNANTHFPTPTHYFEMSIADNSIAAVTDKVDAASFNSFEHNFLVLPTGQVMDFTIDGPTVQIYTPSGSPNPSWAPAISSVSSSLNPGQTYSLSGTQLNGLSEGAYYGDDTNASTNFPLVRITNNATSHVFYARTLNHSSRSIAPGAASSTSFTVPALAESGASTLVAVANGIPSAAVAVTISNTPALVVTPATQIISSGPPGGSFTPASFQYQLSATTGSVGYSISGLPTWLTASSTSGTATTVPTTITFTVNASANVFADGVHGPTTITFTNTTNGVGTVIRSATLKISNDNFSAARTIQAGQIQIGSNVGATKEVGEPNLSFNNGGKSVWWKFTAPAAGTYNVNTEGSSFNTILGIFTGSAVNALTLVVSNDNVSAFDSTSTASFSAVAGTTYSIMVDGFNGASGNIQLQVTAGPSLALDVTPGPDISAAGTQGGPFSPGSFQYQLSSSTGSVNYSISGVPAWLTASSTSGTVTTSPTVVTFTVNTSANSLAVGNYAATISFTNTTNSQGNQTRGAALTVNSGGGGGGSPVASSKHRRRI